MINKHSMQMTFGGKFEIINSVQVDCCLALTIFETGLKSTECITFEPIPNLHKMRILKCIIQLKPFNDPMFLRLLLNPMSNPEYLNSYHRQGCCSLACTSEYMFRAP